MSLLKTAGDLVYTFRFIRMLVLKWPEWDAYKQGIIDDNGKRIKSVKLDTQAKKDAWTPFIRLCANIKRLISKIPGGGSRLGGFVSALYLIKENGNLKDKDIQKILESVDINDLDFLSEENQWFMREDGTISPGVYQVEEYKLLNSSLEEMVFPKDKIRIKEDTQPVGKLFGIDVYTATHLRTNQQIYVTNREIYK
tara:strand:+ start:1478 stop:2065 length:588 start_codon:yes stop_codon:yes gene_type:complete